MGDSGKLGRKICEPMSEADTHNSNWSYGLFQFISIKENDKILGFYRKLEKIP